MIGIFDALPEAIDNSLGMFTPNEPITIYEGNFTIHNAKVKLEINGSIEYRWFPTPRPVFAGTSNSAPIIMGEENEFKLIIGNEEFGTCRIVELTTYVDNHDFSINGVIIGPSIKGDRTMACKKAKFYIPNLMQLSGHTIKKSRDGNVSTNHGRLIFDTPKYEIIIEKDFNYRQNKKALSSLGGYLILYTGEIRKKKGAFNVDEVRSALKCFSTFLSFINGRSTAAMFVEGICNDQTVWTDFSHSYIEPFKSVKNWLEERQAKRLDKVWEAFHNLWNNKDDRNFIETAIGWYLDANSLNGGLHGSIVMAQTALELIYNWLIIERKKIIAGKDAENIAAANKIRLLLSTLNVDYSIPAGLKNLLEYKRNETQKSTDGPEIVVQIRNAIVHSQVEKRKKLSSINFEARMEALDLYVWYIELALLYIFSYTGMYINRCSSELFMHSKLEETPWTKK